MMTSFAFILGLLPLVLASGAGAATQRAVGTAVFGGMLASAIFGLLLIPGLYVVFQWLRETVKARFSSLTRAGSPTEAKHSPSDREPLHTPREEP
jgi:hypothetical protein